MQRPVMNPMFVETLPTPAVRIAWWRRIIRLIGRIPRAFVADLRFWRRGPVLQVEDAPLWRKAIDSILYRLLFTPVLVLLVLGAIVYFGTHPQRHAARSDPLSLGIYYDPVSFTSEDGTAIEGWLVPAIDARTVVDQKEQALRIRRPAVVLVHDFGCTRAQMLPLVRPLHDAGYIVLAINLRGASGTWGACTFGLREAGDVQAAVELLRRRTGVDPDHIAVIGIGTGANAALIAAERTTVIGALVLDHPATGPDALIADHLAPRQPWLQGLRPICKWVFEISYRVDLDEIGLARHAGTMNSRPMLLFDSSGDSSFAFRAAGTAQIRDFLRKHMPVESPTADAR